MKTRLFRLSGIALLTVALLIGCPMPSTAPSGSGGSLTIQVGNHINSQTLLPPISMTPVSYAVSGTGPGGATFSQTTSGASVTVDHLAFGGWNITVNALNSDGTLIGSGNSSATVHTGQTTTVAISVVPLTGNGSLNLTVSWTASQVEIPSIVASLTPPTGPATTLSFAINGSQATYSSTSIPAGYQTLTVQLMDNNIAVMGAVEVVRIVAGQTTSGTYAFTNVNQPGGSVVVNITPDLADPIPVSISGVPATISAGTSVTATASVSDGTTGAVYVWYLNGVSVGTGESLTFGSALAAGYYRLDVTAYTATRAGSATANLQVSTESYFEGKLYLTSLSENRVYLVNPSTGNVRVFLDQTNGLIRPIAIGTDSSGNVYVVNYNNDPSPSFVQVFASNGALIGTLQGVGQRDYSIAVDQTDQIFIGETTVGSQGIHVFDSSRNHLRKLDTSGYYAHSIAAGPDGYLYWWCGSTRFIRSDKVLGGLSDFMEVPGFWGGIAFTPDAMVLGVRYAISYGQSKHAVRKYDLNGQLLSELFVTTDWTLIPNGVAIHNEEVFVATEGGYLLTLDLANGSVKNTLLLGTAADLTSIAYSAR